jgi:hypothetical protein
MMAWMAPISNHLKWLCSRTRPRHHIKPDQYKNLELV